MALPDQITDQRGVLHGLLHIDSRTCQRRLCLLLLFRPLRHPLAPDFFRVDFDIGRQLDAPFPEHSVVRVPKGLRGPFYVRWTAFGGYRR